MKKYYNTYGEGQCKECGSYGKIITSDSDNIPRCNDCFTTFLINWVKGDLNAR